MSMLKRRLQILIDDDRHERINAEAVRRGVSVGRVVREAIDRSLPPRQSAKRESANAILRARPMEVPDPASLREELDRARGERR